MVVADPNQNNMSLEEETPLDVVPTPLVHDSNESTFAESTMEGSSIGEEEVGQEGSFGDGGE